MDVFREWDRLCEEHDTARDEYFHALSVVRWRFASIGQEESKENPTKEELERLAITRRAWEDLMEKMDEFISKHASGS